MKQMPGFYRESVGPKLTTDASGSTRVTWR
jgi:hypothetical protein